MNTISYIMCRQFDGYSIAQNFGRVKLGESIISEFWRGKYWQMTFILPNLRQSFAKSMSLCSLAQHQSTTSPHSVGLRTKVV